MWFASLIASLLIALASSGSAPADVPDPGPHRYHRGQCPYYPNDPTVAGCAYRGRSGRVHVWVQRDLGEWTTPVRRHELGHAFDFNYMSPAEHREWARIVHARRFWPEGFAETYRMCHTGKLSFLAYDPPVSQAELTKVCEALWRWRR